MFYALLQSRFHLSWSPRLVVIIPPPRPLAKGDTTHTTCLLTTLRSTQDKMLASYSTCLFSGVCAALVAVAVAYYLYW